MHVEHKWAKTKCPKLPKEQKTTQKSKDFSDYIWRNSVCFLQFGIDPGNSHPFTREFIGWNCRHWIGWYFMVRQLLKAPSQSKANAELISFKTPFWIKRNLPYRPPIIKTRFVAKLQVATVSRLVEKLFVLRSKKIYRKYSLIYSTSFTLVVRI